MWWNRSDRFLKPVWPVCAEHSQAHVSSYRFILKTCWEIWICNNHLLNLIYVLDLRTLVMCATMCVMYTKCSKWLNVSLWCMFVWWMSCFLVFLIFVCWLGETGMTGFAPDSTHLCCVSSFDCYNSCHMHHTFILSCHTHLLHPHFAEI
jgi:hypothetical protein